jgi:transformation/transcription domain-associated protein
MSMFKEIFTELIDYLVERIQSNYALQIIPNSFLANSTTSPTFASILLNFLLKVHVCYTVDRDIFTGKIFV